MKKLLGFSSSKFYLFSGVGLLVTLAAFWHYQSNQTQLERMNVLGRGVTTCFNRITQTFTAMMIKDLRSPYLERGFMGLSDECLNETIKGINPFRQEIGKGHETLNQLISEVHWFHEKVLKINGPALSEKIVNDNSFKASLSSLIERFTKMEQYKETLVDEIDVSIYQIRKIQVNDQVLLGVGLLIFVLGLTVLSLQEFNRIQIRNRIENDALNFLKSGHENVGSLVDALVDNALLTHSLPVTAKIFRDYHEGILEKISFKNIHDKKKNILTDEVEKNDVYEIASEINDERSRTSLKEVLVTIQNLHPEGSIKLSNIRDAHLDISFEIFEQMMNAAVNQLMLKKIDNKKIMVSTQIHSDRVILNIFLAESVFSASELEFFENKNAISADSIDMNLIILKEMVSEAKVQWYLENKKDRSGNISGMNIRFTIPRAAKERSRVISVVRGKKRDLQKNLVN